MRLALIMLGVGLVGCAAEAAETNDGVDAGTNVGTCETAPLLTWQTFGEAFLISKCQGCHSATTPDRRGAPVNVDFDTPDDVRSHNGRIGARVGDGTMPPGGGLSANEVTDLEDWLACDLCTQGRSPGCPTSLRR